MTAAVNVFPSQDVKYSLSKVNQNIGYQLNFDE